MHFIKICFFIVFSLYLVGCSAAYNELADLEYSKPIKFQQYIFNEYKTKAKYEAEEMHDWNSAKLYSEKAIRSISTDKIYPEKLSKWKLPKERISEIANANESLMIVYEQAKMFDPQSLAKAIVSLDCWSEQQEEIWQKWDIDKCKDDFFYSMQKIYTKTLEKVKNNNSDYAKSKVINSEDTKIIIKKEHNDILQIIYFDFDEIKLSKVSIDTLKRFLKKNRKEINEYLIVGHTDTKGGKDYNLNLSVKRAEFVKQILIENNIELNKIKILGKGEEALAILTADDVKHPANRRVEIKKSN